jgi:methyl-accepting chemotaxis protein
MSKAQTGGFGIDAKYWFDTITKKINVLKSVEDYLSKAIIKDVQNIKDELYQSLIFVSIFSLASLFMLIVVSYIFARSINKVLHTSISNIQQSSQQILHASSEITSASTMLSNSASEETADIEEMSTSVEMIINGVEENDDIVQEASGLSAQMISSVNSSYKNLEELTVSMEKINSFSKQTSNIIKTIDEIAFQTNLLALNAAVEAARAGEHGLGFAVVAEEVRSLANRSAEAVQETESIIDNIIYQIDNGTNLTTVTNQSFENIKKQITHNTDLISNIMDISSRQKNSVYEIKGTMKNITGEVQTLASNSEELAATAEELYTQINSMSDSIDSISSLVK